MENTVQVKFTTWTHIARCRIGPTGPGAPGWGRDTGTPGVLDSTEVSA